MQTIFWTIFQRVLGIGFLVTSFNLIISTVGALSLGSSGDFRPTSQPSNYSIWTFKPVYTKAFRPVSGSMWQSSSVASSSVASSSVASSSVASSFVASSSVAFSPAKNASLIQTSFPCLRQIREYLQPDGFYIQTKCSLRQFGCTEQMGAV